MTAALTARIDAAEYKARILALAAVYWSLGIRPGPRKTVNDLLRKKSAWAVLSFHHVAPEDAAFQAAAAAAQGSLNGPRRYAVSGFIIGSILLVALHRYLPPPGTPLMLLRRVEGYGIRKSWTSFDHISTNLVRAVIASEEIRFCNHHGFDWNAIETA